MEEPGDWQQAPYVPWRGDFGDGWARLKMCLRMLSEVSGKPKRLFDSKLTEKRRKTHKNVFYNIRMRQR